MQKTQGVVWLQKSLWVRVWVSNKTIACQGYAETHTNPRNVTVTRYFSGTCEAIYWCLKKSYPR